MTASPQASFTVEYPCAKHCSVEVDLSEVSQQFTLRQMWANAHQQHEKRHAPAPEPSPVQAGVAAAFRAPV